MLRNWTSGKILELFADQQFNFNLIGTIFGL